MANRDFNIERLRQTNVANIVNTVQSMAQINRLEAEGELTDAQAETLRQRLPHVADLDKANIDRLKQEAERLRLTNPGSAAAQDAETRWRNAQAARTEQETIIAKSLGDLPIQKAKAELEKLEQDIQEGKRTVEIEDDKGRKITIPAKTYYEGIIRSLAARGDRDALTRQQEIENERNVKEREEKLSDDADKAENIILNKPDADNTVEAGNFNRNSPNRDYVYLARPNTGWTGPNNKVVKIPIPRVATPGGGETAFSARVLHNMWRTQPAFKAMSWKQFLQYVYQNMAKQSLPPELQD